MTSPLRMVSVPVCGPEVLHRNMCVHRATYDAADFTSDAFKKFASVVDAAKGVTGIDPKQGTFLLPRPFATALKHRERYDLTPSNKKDLFMLKCANSAGDAKEQVMQHVEDALSSFGDENNVVEVYDNGDAIEVLAVVVLPCTDCGACSSSREGGSSITSTTTTTSPAFPKEDSNLPSCNQDHSMRVAITLIIERQDPCGFSSNSIGSSSPVAVQNPKLGCYSAGGAWISRWGYSIKIFSVFRCNVPPHQANGTGASAREVSADTRDPQFAHP